MVEVVAEAEVEDWAEVVAEGLVEGLAVQSTSLLRCCLEEADLAVLPRFVSEIFSQNFRFFSIIERPPLVQLAELVVLG